MIRATGIGHACAAARRPPNTPLPWTTGAAILGCYLVFRWLGSRTDHMMSAWSSTFAAIVASLLTVVCQPTAKGTSNGVDVPKHAVLVHLRLSNDAFGTREEMQSIHALSDRLEAKIIDAQAGEFDGDEFGQGECVLFMYGPNADTLFAAIESELRASPLSRGGWAIKRYGPADDATAEEVRIELDAR